MTKKRMKFFSGYDLGIVIPAIGLLAISLVVLSSLDMDFFQNQLIFSILAGFLFIAFSMLDVRAFKHTRLILYVISVGLLVSLFIFGFEVRGARRWVEFLGVRIQFSEFIKPMLILAFASLLSSWEGKVTLKRLILSAGLFAIPAFLVFRQPDLGSAIVYTAAYAFMLLAGGLHVGYIFAGAISVIVLFPLVWHVLADYQRNRLLTFINPGHDPLGIGYNAMQASIAVGSGLLFGRGLGRGVQSQLQFLPEHHTDFIFATFSEEFGFLGSFVLLLLYFFLLYRLLIIAQNCKSRFSYYTVFGVFSLILAQVFINIGMNIRLVPITGVTLPLVSYGGSSLLATGMLLGLVNSISRSTRQKQDILEIR